MFNQELILTDITEFRTKPIANLLANLELHKANPTLIQRTILDHLSEVTDGKVNIVDPTNPFIFLLEASSVNTSLAVKESILGLRKQYPSLALSEDDIYRHMSDVDFIDRFSKPSEAKITFMISYTDFLNKAIRDESEKCSKVIIPRDTTVKVDNIDFTLNYPVIIRNYDNGVVQISRDVNIASPLESLSGNIVTYEVRKDPSGQVFITFDIPFNQFKINTFYNIIEASSLFKTKIAYENKFYYCRVFNKSSLTNDNWVEIKTTHSDQVYDKNIPTAVVRVYNAYLELYIPLIYTFGELIKGEIRIDVYTTKGKLTVNLADYKTEAFTTKFTVIDEARDKNIYTEAMNKLSYVVFSNSLVSGGEDHISFEQLRERVIYNSIGDRSLPITNNQLESYVDNKGFDLIKNVDVVTNRIFLATKKLPKPINEKLITSASIGISTFVNNPDSLKTHYGFKDNGNRLTLLSNTIFKITNGVVTILSQQEKDSIMAMTSSAMVNEINSKQYLYNPFYYVLDSNQQEFEVRCYNLDQPFAKNLNFIRQNQTLQLPVNTGSYYLNKISDGYELIVITRSGNFYKSLADSEVLVQLAYRSVNENSLAYINGNQINTTTDGERVYRFKIETNYDIDDKDSICITNGKMFNNESIKTWVALETEFHIFHTTTSINTNFIPDETNTMIGNFLLPSTAVGNTHERLTISLGKSLKNVWTRTRNIPSGVTYKKHTQNIPLLHTEVEYEIDPLTNSIFSFNNTGGLVYNIKNNIGDPVLDNQGDPVFKHKIGDVLLDVEGKPEIDTQLSIFKEIDMLFVDGKYFFTTDSVFVEYRKEIMSVLTKWITEDLKTIQDKLLEQTKLYFYPKTTLNMVKVYPDNVNEILISSEQSLIIDLYVKNDVYNNNSIRNDLTNKSTQIIEEYINNMTINLTELVVLLKNYYGDSVSTVEIKGLGGDKNYRILNVAEEHNRLCLKKVLQQQQDSSIIIKEDIVFNFYNIERLIQN